jgi:hypothetical protein
MKEVTVGDETFTHPTDFVDVDRMTTALQQVKPRNGDILQLNYSKSGK